MIATPAWPMHRLVGPAARKLGAAPINTWDAVVLVQLVLLPRRVEHLAVCTWCIASEEEVSTMVENLCTLVDQCMWNMLYTMCTMVEGLKPKPFDLKIPPVSLAKPWLKARWPQMSRM
mmetsp:Transcript_83754/g.102631  ORF Transcript_83754/g.102631 Transcript_83754/m.102631 type:complete len:118 (+) Transcript_83754:1396-1749(+)